jgi:hypothetical protein
MKLNTISLVSQSSLTANSQIINPYVEPTMQELMSKAHFAYEKINQDSNWDPTYFHPLEPRTHGYLKSCKVSSSQREHDALGQKSRYNKNGGAKTHVSSNISVTHNKSTGEESYSNTQHGSCFKLWDFEQKKLASGWSQEQIDAFEHTVEVVYVNSDSEEMDVFDTLNATGIKPVSQEQTIIARYFKGIKEDIAVVRILQATGRKFSPFTSWHPAPFGGQGGLADNFKIVSKGKFVAACKADPQWAELIRAVDANPTNEQNHFAIVKKMAIYKWFKEVIDVIPEFAKEEKDSVQLAEGAVDLLLNPNVKILHSKPEPWNTFTQYFQDTISADKAQYDYVVAGPKGKAGVNRKDYKFTQEDFCFTGLRSAQKDGSSIAFLLLWSFWASEAYTKKFPQGVKGLGRTAVDLVRQAVHPSYMNAEFNSSKNREDD